ncbi:ricin-type beta-trefoil lectin domain protein [Saccharopolyspora rosea]|uniref:Ricin-type beta-trefoil lectin domain protein n=1 Tax=Saccharopolyspora rosea TaxID=524884 RepID=A0ABW3FRI1_9PSEU|nr:ricin-type beta-trefoil lectin domain protein [Saccharopolyspora rosea]
MRKLSHWSAAVLGALCLSGAVAMPIAGAAPASSDMPIRNVATGDCLGHLGGDRIGMFPCDSHNPAQMWTREHTDTADMLQVGATRECLGHMGGSDVRLFPCESSNRAQQWRVERAGSDSARLINLATNDCLTQVSRSDVRLEECTDHPAQEWLRERP